MPIAKKPTREFERYFTGVRHQFDQHKLIVTQKKWKAYLSTDQLNLTNNTDTKIVFNTLAYDCDGAGFSSYGYPVSERGLYLVILHVLFLNVLTDHMYRGMIKNSSAGDYSSDVWNHPSIGGAGKSLSCKVVDIVPANVGDVIYGYARSQSGDNSVDLAGGAEKETYMTIHLVSRRCF